MAIRSVWRGLAYLVLGGCLPVATVLTVLRAAPATQELPGAGLVSAFSAYALGLWVIVALVLAALFGGRRRARTGMAALLALALAGLHAWWIAPFYVADDQPAGGRPLTIVSLNVLGGAGDTNELIAQAKGADIVVLLEYDLSTEFALDQAGFARTYPYRTGTAENWADGSAVYSRLRLGEARRLNTLFGTYLVQVDPGGPDAFTLVAGHPVNPLTSRRGWLSEAAQIREAVVADRAARLVVIGDLNSTPDHVTMRRLMDGTGLREATDLVGRGWPRTWPANRMVPPLLGLDQALIRGQVAARSVETLAIRGTDHLGIRVRLSLL